MLLIAVFLKYIADHPEYKQYFNRIDSCGTSNEHSGQGAHRHTQKVLMDMKIPLDHIARQIKVDDFFKFDYILCMDDWNLSDLKRLQKHASSKGNSQKSMAKVMLIGDFSPHKKGEIVGDPWYGGISGFYEVLDQLTKFTEQFCKFIKARAIGSGELQ